MRPTGWITARPVFSSFRTPDADSSLRSLTPLSGRLPVLDDSEDPSRGGARKGERSKKWRVFLRGIYAFLLLLVLSGLLPLPLAAPKKPSRAARKEDITFIKCQVCEKIAHQIYQQVKKKETQISPKKISEFQIIEIAEKRV